MKLAIMRSIIIIVSSMLGATIRASAQAPLQTVSHVDVPSYMGLWYEIASYPQWFSKDCYNTTAEYVLRSDGKVDVTNSCHKGRPDGRLSVARGVARVTNTTTNAELKVSFFWPFSGDYWIIELGQHYEYAVVSEPGRSTLWILSRTQSLDESVLQELLVKLREVHGFDTSMLKFTQG